MLWKNKEPELKFAEKKLKNDLRDYSALNASMGSSWAALLAG
jgi:hypothetical protein